MQTLIRRGRCHLFGNDIPLDDGLIPFDLAIRRVDDPAQLVPELLRLVDPGFPARVRSGDIVVAGRDFAGGKPHFQGFIAMASLGISVLCGSMPYKSLRGAVSKGVPVLCGLEPAGTLRDGDELKVDFGQGTVCNLTRGGMLQVPALSSDLVDMVCRGGTRGALSAHLAAHPEFSTPWPEVRPAQPRTTEVLSSAMDARP